MMQYQEAYNRLEQYGQTHLLRYYDTLSAAEQEALLQQISEMDFSVLERAAHEEAPKGKIEPLGACTISEIAEKQDTYRKIGLEAIRKGSVGAVLLAGGQGSRLGCNGPKGVFRIGINNDLTIFECLFRNLMDVTEQAGVPVPLFIMTSETNDAETRKAVFRLSGIFCAFLRAGNGSGCGQGWKNSAGNKEQNCSFPEWERRLVLIHAACWLAECAERTEH